MMASKDLIDRAKRAEGFGVRAGLETIRAS